MIKVIVVDDQPLEGKMIDFVLSRDCPAAAYAGQAYNAEEAISLARETRPDVIFLDITMPGKDGIRVIQDLKAIVPECRIVMLTAHDDFNHIRDSMRAGANDYLLKPTRPRDVVEAFERWSRQDGETENDPVEAAKQYAERHLESSITLSEMSEKLYLSPSYFSRLFKQRTGMTFSAWLAQRRIVRAQRYLTETSFSIAEIAAKVGYQEANSFTRLFRGAVGMTPTEYRKAHRNTTG